MKKINMFLIVVAFSGFLSNAQQQIQLQPEANGLKITANRGTAFTASFSFSELGFQRVSSPVGFFSEISVPEFTYRYHDGYPAIPVLAKLIEIPGNVQVSISVVNYSERILLLSDYGIYDKIMPAQPSYHKSTDPSDIQFFYNEGAYNINDFNQNPLVTIDYQGMARGIGIAQMIIDPIRYNPVTNQLKIINNIEFRVEFSAESYPQYVAEKERVYNPLFRSFYSKLPNFSQLPDKDLITKYPIKYVIVSSPLFRDSLAGFIQWKTQKGFNVIEAYTDNPAVGSTTTSIKSYLQGLYNAGTPEDPPPTFVLLVGDVAQIPTFSGTAGTHPSDMYYVEYTGGADFIPESYIGRFSATNISQLMPQINKTLQYEKFTMPVSTYMDTVVLVSGVDGTFAITHGNGQINYGTNNYFNSAHGIYSHTYLYPTSSESWVDADMRAKIGAGTGIANYTAHCGETGWGDPSFSTSHVPSMNNVNKYGLMIGNCCLSNKFDYSECFGEAVLRVPNKGAVGYLGGSNNTYWDEDFWWGVGYTSSITANPTYAGTGLGAYDKVFHDHGEPYTDWFVTNAQINYAGNTAVQASTSGMKKYYWEIYHLMGDPSVMTYLWNPDPLIMTYNTPLIVGDQSLLVNCEPYTLVAISRGDSLLDAEFSGANNFVTLQFSPLSSSGTALIVGTKQNRAPHIQEIDIEEINLPVDAQVMQIQNLQNTYTCINMNIQPKVVIRNKGLNALTQITINYQWDNSAVQSLNWTGNLLTLDTTHVLLPQHLVTSGNHSLKVFSSDPNGNIDMNNSNDTLVKQYSAQDLPVDVDFAASVTDFCNAPATVQFVNSSSNAQSYLWDFGDGTYSVLPNPTHQYMNPGLFTVSLTAYAGICGSDIKIQNNYILVGAEPPVTYSAANCGPASLTLTANALSDVLWYDDVTGTNLIHTGTSYTTPLLNATTTFFCGTEIINTYSGGKQDNSGTGGYFTGSTEHGLVFNCNVPTLLKSVKVYFGGTTAADKTIKLMNGSTQISSVLVNIPPGENRITLNMDIPAGTNLKLTGPGSSNLYRNGSQTTIIGYPLQVGNNISITQGTASGYALNYYYYFYDWEVEEICKSTLIPVSAYIQSIPVSNFSYSGNGYIMNFSNLSTGGGGADYLWDFGDGTTSTLENPEHFYSSTGTYNVSLQVTNTCGTNISDQTVNITGSTDEYDRFDVLKIHPNPASDFCTISAEFQIDEVFLYDITGRLIFQKKHDSHVFILQLSDLNKGNYILKIHSDDKFLFRKLIIK